MVSARNNVHDARMALIATTYCLHGALRSSFAGPQANTGLVLLEALALGTICNDPHPPTVSEIGRALGFSRQSVQRAVNKLVSLDLVRAAPNPRHKTAPLFVVTEAGATRMLMVEAPSRRLAAELADSFDDMRAQRLLEEMTDLLAAITAKGRSREPE